MRKLLAGTALGLVMFGHAAIAQTGFSSLVVFGDSLSDNGNIPKIIPPALLGAATASAELPLPPYYNFHFSNGPIYAEKLGPLLGITAPLSDSAVGGAYSAPLHETIGNTSLNGVNINPALSALSVPNNGSGTVVDSSVQGQINSYLSGGNSVSRNGLYVVWGGANDYFSLFNTLIGQAGSLSLTQIQAYIQQQVGITVANLSQDVALLAQAGAKSIIVPTLPNLGGTPQFNGNAITASLGQLTTVSHDTALATAMGALGQKYGVNIYLIDTNALFMDAEAHPGKYGLTNVTTACLSNGTVCASPNTNLFWDSVHPTTVVQALFAELVTSTVEAPLVIGAQGKIADINSQTIFDGISSRVAALQLGANGISLEGPGGASTHLASNDPVSVYITGGYGRSLRKDQINEAGFTANSGTIQAGADLRSGDNLAFGVQAGFNTIGATLKDGMGNDDVRSYSVALYGATFTDHWYGSLAGFYSYQQWDKLNRNTLLEGEVATGSTAGSTVGAKLEGGYLFRDDGFTYGPTADFRISRVTINGYTEQGAVALNQVVDDQAYSSIIGELGGRVATDIESEGVLYRPSLQIGWNHQYGPAYRHVFSRLAALPQATIDTALPSSAQDWARVGLGLSVRANSTLAVVANVDGTIGRSDGQDISGLVKILFQF